ncbi:hypothetical protein [Pseudomonas sp. B1(2018)]|uniref:hypothetical protein n=1 Tax=Pseudomonas sp. B1(2018) TaxID=2233856 RepID=UPI0010581CBB|nr:hypothetical protein [Pseudomonas sp. B1(2018)]
MEVKAAAEVKVEPKGNHIMVNLLVAASVLFGFHSVWLYSESKPFGLSLLLTGVFLVPGLASWWLSHRNESLQQSHPFLLGVEDGDKQIKVTADVRALPPLDYLKGLLSEYSATFYREPLPEPSGTVGENGEPIAGRVNEALAIANNANKQAQVLSEGLAKSLKGQSCQLPLSDSPIVSTYLEVGDKAQ